ncbi:MAG TPA: polysaccharide pyruvyl transferase family protein, partial [Polyangium sp.]|nr:polysaccharide pyruvyl transferase family protein [Polyangium sp.]
MAVNVVFDGAFSIDSAGDDAPLAFMVHELRKRLDHPRFTALVRHPDWRLARRLGVETAANLEHETKAASLGRWYRGLNFGDSRAELGSIAEVVANADLLVLGAGNFLTEVGIDVLRGHLPRFVSMSLAAQMAGTPTLLFGLSANLLRNPLTARAAKWLLQTASAVTFRERIAIENLEASGVRLPEYRLLPDPALGAPSAAIDVGDTELYMTEIAEYVFVPVFGATRDLPRLVGLRDATDLLLWGKRLDAREAARIGLVDAVLPAREGEAAVEAFVDGVVEAPWRHSTPPEDDVGAIARVTRARIARLPPEVRPAYSVCSDLLERNARGKDDELVAGERERLACGATAMRAASKAAQGFFFVRQMADRACRRG